MLTWLLIIIFTSLALEGVHKRLHEPVYKVLTRLYNTQWWPSQNVNVVALINHIVYTGKKIVAPQYNTISTFVVIPRKCIKKDCFSVTHNLRNLSRRNDLHNKTQNVTAGDVSKYIHRMRYSYIKIITS